MNNASISGYAYFPATTTYAAAKAGVVAFSESLRRELRGTGVGVLHLVTPGVETDMMDDTDRSTGATSTRAAGSCSRRPSGRRRSCGRSVQTHTCSDRAGG